MLVKVSHSKDEKFSPKVEIIATIKEPIGGSMIANMISLAVFPASWDGID
jgi:hypothetical protein